MTSSQERIFLLVARHHGMLRDTVNEDGVNVVPGSGDLYFYMGKIGVMAFAFIKAGF